VLQFRCSKNPITTFSDWLEQDQEVPEMSVDMTSTVYLEAVIESAADAIVTDDEHGLITGWNPAAERIFGYSRTAVLGQPLTLFIPERFHAAHEAGLHRVAQTGQTRVIGRTVELAGLRGSGEKSVSGKASHLPVNFVKHATFTSHPNRAGTFRFTRLSSNLKIVSSIIDYTQVLIS
jgi:PAS domain S-box-containing protein